MYYPFGRYTVTFSFPYVEEPFWGTSWFSQQTDDHFVQLTPFYSLIRCHEVSSTPILQFPAKSVLHPFLYQPGNQLLSANRMLTVSLAWNLRENCFVEMTLQPSLPADVLWGSFVTRNECVTNEPQRTSAGRLSST